MLGSVTVTREMLIADQACDPAIDAFDFSFPCGSATLQEIVDHYLCEPDWLGWLAAHGSFIASDIAMLLIQWSGDPGKYYGEAAIWADWVTAETGPEIISKSSEPRHIAKRAILLADWMTPEIKAELIAKYGL